MESLEGCKVFKVDFGRYDYKFVIAKTFDMAEKKAIEEVRHEEAVKKISVLDNDGSLIKQGDEKEIIVKGIEILCQQVIF